MQPSLTAGQPTIFLSLANYKRTVAIVTREAKQMGKNGTKCANIAQGVFDVGAAFKDSNVLRHGTLSNLTNRQNDWNFKTDLKWQVCRGRAPTTLDNAHEDPLQFFSRSRFYLENLKTLVRVRSAQQRPAAKSLPTIWYTNIWHWIGNSAGRDGIICQPINVVPFIADGEKPQ